MSDIDPESVRQGVESASGVAGWIGALSVTGMVAWLWNRMTGRQDIHENRITDVEKVNISILGTLDHQGKDITELKQITHDITVHFDSQHSKTRDYINQTIENDQLKRNLERKEDIKATVKRIDEIYKSQRKGNGQDHDA